MNLFDDPYANIVANTFEGFQPQASWDYKQYTNGYGTRARYPGETLDREEAARRFQSEWGNANGQVSAFAPNLDPGKQAALSSLTLNAGSGWMNSGLGEAVRQGDWDRAARLFGQYSHAGGAYNQGLANRRAQELAWFNGGSPGALSNQGTRTMADYEQPALSSASLAGPGGLFNGGDYGFGHKLQQAAAWLMAGAGHPEALGPALASRDQFTPTTLPDGSVALVNHHTGRLTPVSGPQPQVFDAGTDFMGNPQKMVRIGSQIMPIAQYLSGQQAVGGAGGGSVPGGNVPSLGAGAGAAASTPGLAKGVTQYNPDLVGEDYVNQFSPELRQSIIDYKNGLSTPVGNPRKTAFIKEAASKYAADLGEASDETTFAARRKMRIDLASNANNSLKQQRDALNTSFGQIADLAKAYEDNRAGGLGNGLPIVNQAANAVARATGFAPSLSDFDNTMNALAEEATRLARGNAGAEADIQRVLKNINYNSSPAQFYASLDALKRTFQRRAAESDADIQETLRGDAAKYPMIREEGAAALKRYEDTRDQSLGRKKSTGAQAAPGVLKPGTYNWTPENGLVLQ